VTTDATEVGKDSLKWECMGCGSEYSERFHAATCCTFPGPDYTSAKPIDPETGEPPEPWIGEKSWRHYDE